MRSSLKERIANALLNGVLLFIMLCVMHKFLDKTGWVSNTVIWCLAWTIGYFVSRTLNTVEESIWKLLGIDLIIIFLAFLLLAFIFGVVCHMENWTDIVSTITCSFGMSMIWSNKCVELITFPN